MRRSPREHGLQPPSSRSHLQIQRQNAQAETRRARRRKSFRIPVHNRLAALDVRARRDARAIHSNCTRNVRRAFA